MTKPLQAKKWSTSFVEYMGNEARTLDIQQYEFCLDEWMKAHEKKMITSYLMAIALFCVGLWAVYEHVIFLAVLTLALAANFNRQSADHILVSEVMDTERLLGMLINKQSQEMQSLRRDVVKWTSSSGHPPTME